MNPFSNYPCFRNFHLSFLISVRILYAVDSPCTSLQQLFLILLRTLRSSARTRHLLLSPGSLLYMTEAVLSWATGWRCGWRTVPSGCPAIQSLCVTQSLWWKTSCQGAATGSEWQPSTEPGQENQCSCLRQCSLVR